MGTETIEENRAAPAEPARVGNGPVAVVRFWLRNGMVTPKYMRLVLRLARRKLLTPTGRRLRLGGMLFMGRDVALQIGKRAQVRTGRWVWIGDGTKIRCHEGEISIGAKTVLGQECTLSAYRQISIGEQCIIADRVMMIDFDHCVTDVERPVRTQGIYKRGVRVGNNVWIGYGAQILRGVLVGDNSIIGASAVVTKDVPANAVIAGSPARVVRMRKTPQDMHWEHPVEP